MVRVAVGGLTALATLIGLAAGPAFADTFYGPTGTPGAGVFPQRPAGGVGNSTTPGPIGNPTVIHLTRGGNPTGQALEDAANSATPGAEARTWDANGTNAQRVYFQYMSTQTTFVYELDGSGNVREVMSRLPVYRILHYTQAGAMCLDADASSGRATVGSRVQWVWCHENWLGNPQQLWYVAPSTRDGQPGLYPSIVNFGAASSPDTGPRFTTAPVLAASANLPGVRSGLTLVSRSSALVQNSVWDFQDVGPVATPPGHEPCTNKVECLVAGGNPTPGCYFFCIETLFG